MAGKTKGFIILKASQAAQVTYQNCKEKGENKPYISFTAMKIDWCAVPACYFSPSADIL